MISRTQLVVALRMSKPQGHPAGSAHTYNAMMAEWRAVVGAFAEQLADAGHETRWLYDAVDYE